MYKDKTFLAVIPARGGSKRIPRKNLLMVGNKSLLERTIITAQNSAFLDRVILSSEDPEIIEHALGCGCEIPFCRPVGLADDTASSFSVLEHAINNLEETYDYIVLLQPTSPLRVHADIDLTIKTCIDRKALACVTVNTPQQSPFLCCTLSDERRIKPLIDIRFMQGKRGQDLSDTYCINGAVYVAETIWFLKNRTFVTEDTAVYIMPLERSIDIDTWEDVRIAEGLI
jgi:N-acylneuraminate cytidylyltransferase